MIVGSILLAFGIQAWWDNAQERQIESETLAGLATDFSENELQVSSQLRLRGSLITAASSLLEALEANPPGAGIVVEHDVLGRLISSPTLDPFTSTMDSALSSGQLGLIRSAVVREHLADWRRVLTGLHENELAVRDVVHRLVAPALSSSQASLAAAAKSRATMAPGGTTAGVQEIRPAQDLEGAVSLYLFNSELVARDLQRLLDIQAQLTLALSSELAR